ncbi:hypothetical protein [Streptomyces sp. NPDC051000]|uniref:hypothetical protein n=1 Tax=Streptomyces sp. NPDC051000 TaxID=3155520 RepID=UPI0033EC5592
MAGKFGTLATVVAAATAAVAFAGGPASAADTAYNTRSVYLNGVPKWSDADACVTKNISLTSGTYTWTQIFGSSRTPTREIYLASGSYSWTDCIRAFDGHYKQNSTLSRSGSASAVLNDDTQYHWIAGTYTFGSLLDPHF